MNSAALDRAGPDQRHLDDEVVERTRPQPRQSRHLRTALDLKQPDGVGAANLVVDPLLLLRDRREGPTLAEMRLDGVHAVAQGRQHAQAEQVELHQPHRGAIVLVPLEHGAFVHPRVLDRAHVTHRLASEHHAAGVDSQVPRELQQVVRELEYVGRNPIRIRRCAVLWLRVFRADGVPAVDPLRPGVLLPDAVPECLGHVADRGAWPVGDDVGDLSRVASPVLLVDVLDDLLAAAGVDVDIDVGFLVAGRRQETLERQLVLDRVDRGDPECVADRGVRRRPATLAQDPFVVGELNDVMHDQEVAREVLLLNHLELLVQPLVRVRKLWILRRSVALAGTTPGELPQPAHQVVAVGGLQVWQLRGGRPQRERELGGEVGCPLNHPVVRREQPLHLGARPQVRLAGHRQPTVQLVQATPGTHGSERHCQPPPVRSSVMDIICRDCRYTGFLRDLPECVVAFMVERVAMGIKLADDVLLAEQRLQPVELSFGCGESFAAGGGSGRSQQLTLDASQCTGDQAFTAAGQHGPVSIGPLGQRLQ